VLAATVPTVRLGIFGLNSFGAADPDVGLALARLAEELGYESLWAGEHVVLPSPRVAPAPMEPTDPIHDPLVWLAVVAGVTSRVLLGTGIVILPQRHPLVLAKQAASLDVLSGGRLLLGIGAGYLEPELSAIGIPMTERGSRTDEHLDVMRALWTEPGPVTFHGRYTDFAGIDAYPRPVRPGGPRLVVGGWTPSALRRAVSRGHGWYGFLLSAEDAAEQVESLGRAAREVTRPAELGRLEISVTPRGRMDADGVRAYADAGVDRLILYPGDRSAEAVEEYLRRHAALLDLET
jgi:probable F420-dependent oxidoreductase